MGEIVEYKSYQEYKQELDGELQRTAEGFVRIGYLLKVARDTNILEESGYKTVTEFAEAEYNLNKTQVSRFISINDKFSEGGYSDHLLENYKGFGYAKLTIMLQIPEEINEELSVDMSKSDIQAVRDEIGEEQKVSNIEVVLEGHRKGQEDMNMGERVVHSLGEAEPELFKAVFNAFNEKHQLEDLKPAIKAIMAPDGERIYSVRIMGVGRVMLAVSDTDNRCSITPVRTPEEKKVIPWEELIDMLYLLMISAECDEAEKAWEEIYEKDFPGEKVEVAPVQQKEEPKKEQKKQSKVVKAKPENAWGVSEPRLHDYEESIPEPDPVEEEEEIVEMPAAVVEENIPGQDTVEAHEEWMPEPAETPIKTETGDDKARQIYYDSFLNNMELAKSNAEDGMYDIALNDLEDAKRYLKKLMELSQEGKS